MEKHLEILGFKAEDKVTGFKGVVSSVSFDLYGCVQAILTPHADEKGGIPDSRWFDTSRLEIIGSSPVMEVPDFSKFHPRKIPGGQQLPTK